MNTARRIMRMWALCLVLPLFILLHPTVGHAQQTAEDWQKKAVADYPDLGVAGSAMNQRFVTGFNSLKYSNPRFFDDPRWPYILAKQASQAPIIPGVVIPSTTQPQAAPGDITMSSSNAPLATGDLAAAVTKDQRSVDQKLMGQKIYVRGSISSMEVESAAPEGTLVSVYLTTSPSMPRIKLYVTDINPANGATGRRVTVLSSQSITVKPHISVRVVNDELEAKEDEAITHTYHTHSLFGPRNNFHTESGDWQPMAKVGDVITADGVYDGRLGDIVLKDASL